MKGLLRGLALFVVIVSVVWVAVLWRWQATSRDMTTPDILVYLGLLPLVLFGVVLLGRAAWVSAGKREEARAERAAAKAESEGKPTPVTADAAERHATMQLIASPLVTAAGHSASALLSAARDGEPRPSIDDELRDDDGMPLLTARIADLDIDALKETSEAALMKVRAQKPEWMTREPGDHVMRALAALQSPLVDAIEALAPWAPMLSNGPPEIDRTTGRPVSSGPERSVRVLIGWPADWSEFEQEFARLVASGWLAARGAAVLPGTRIATNAQVASGEELLLQADRLMQTLARAHHDEPLIVAACHSAISDSAAAELESASLLYHPRLRPKGQMPGEAACALVLAGASWPAAPDAMAPVPHLHRPALMRRDKSIDAPGRVGPQIAVATMTSALDAGQMKPAAIGGVVATADQHTERGAEFFVAAHELLPELDAGEDLRSIGQVTGGVGGVSALLVVACAAELAISTEKPTLGLSMADGFARLSVLALPGAPAATGAAAPAPAKEA